MTHHTFRNLYIAVALFVALVTSPATAQSDDIDVLFCTFTSQSAPGWVDIDEADGSPDGVWARAPESVTSRLIGVDFANYTRQPNYRIVQVIARAWVRYSDNTSNNYLRFADVSGNFPSIGPFDLGPWNQAAGDTNFRLINFDFTAEDSNWSEADVNAVSFQIRRRNANDGRGGLRVDSLELYVRAVYDPSLNEDGDGDGVPVLSDCDDSNPNIWRNDAFRDADGDGYNDGTKMGETSPCFGNSPPSGWTLNSTLDNCPGTFNPDQTNTDLGLPNGDNLGDACDPDDDGDGFIDSQDCAPLDRTKWRTTGIYPDFDEDGFNDNTGQTPPCWGNTPPRFWTTNSTIDNCPGVFNPGQENTDAALPNGDSLGDACDLDDDGDGINDDQDCAPLDNTKWRNSGIYPDFDEDGFNDNTGQTPPCYGDTVPQFWTTNSTVDNCVGVFNPGQENLDGDELGDACDPDRDGDQVLNELDCAPDDASIWRNDAFPDADMDGFNDGTGEASPCFGDTVPTGWTLIATIDNCVGTFNPDQANLDGDELGDACDVDRDGDGFEGSYSFGGDGSDCDDTDMFVWRNDAYPDADMDGFNDNTGEASPCFGDIVPSGWTLNPTIDNCPFIANPDQLNDDGDAFGNPCDDDDNGNGIPDGPDCASMDTTVWSSQGTLDFFDPKNWNNGTPSMGANIAMFDSTADGLPSIPTPVFTAFSDNLIVGAFTHANKDYRINLNANDLIVTGAMDRNGMRYFELGVDQCLGTVLPPPLERPVLRFSNANIFQAIVRSPSAIIGSEGAADLTIDSSTGNVRFEFTDELIVGKNGNGNLLLNDSRAELNYGDSNSLGGSFVIGVNSQGTVDVFDGTVAAVNTIDQLILGQNEFGQGSIFIDGTTWTHSSDELVIGDHGIGVLAISGGGSFATNITTQTILAKEPGSYAQIIISGEQSEWINLGAPVETGLGEVSLSVEDGAELNVFGYINRTGSDISGDGAINGDVVNFGTVTVGRDGDTLPQTLTINGNFDQFDNPTDPTESGRIIFDLHSDGGSGVSADSLVINGTALLGGSLIVKSDEVLDASIGTELTLITAAGLQGNQFDVALMPGLSGGRFLRPKYNNVSPLPDDESQGQTGSVSLVVDSLSDTVVGDPNGFDTEGLPTNAALGDIDGDGFDDLVLVLPDNEMSGILVLLNGQTTEPPESWPGFSGGSVFLPTGPDPSDVSIGNLDNVNGDDIAVTIRSTGAVETYISNGSSDILTRFSSGPTAFFNESPEAIVLEDFDSDGFLDIAVAGEQLGAPVGFPGLVTIRINLAGGGFGPNIDHTVGDRPVGLGVDDLDNEKDLDLYTANNGSNGVSVLENLGGFGAGWLGFAPSFELEVDSEPVEVFSADLDLDGDIDFITANEASGTLSTILSDPNGAASLSDSYEPSADIPIGGLPSNMTLWDIDNDLDPDPVVIVTNDSSQRVARVLRNLAIENADAGTPGLSFVVDRDLAAGQGPVILLTGQVNSNPEQDLAIVIDSGAARHSRGTATTAGLLFSQAACRADINGDTRLNFVDISEFLVLYQANDPRSDWNDDGSYNFIDISAFLTDYQVGCP